MREAIVAANTDGTTDLGLSGWVPTGVGGAGASIDGFEDPTP